MLDAKKKLARGMDLQYTARQGAAKNSVRFQGCMVDFGGVDLRLDLYPFGIFRFTVGNAPRKS